MIQLRNSLVAVELLPQTEKKIGAITVSTATASVCEAIVVAVGPGSISAEGGRSETFDLMVGQRILITHKAPKQGKMGMTMEISGLEYTENGKVYYIYPQQNIFGILDQPTLN